jgi:Helicase HerA, central domain
MSTLRPLQQLPYWLLTFEELIEVLLGDPQERKAEIELLQDMIPMAKARYGAGRGNAREAGLRRVGDARYTVDTPVPYRISDLIQTIDDRMGKLENKRDLSPYRNLKTRLEAISLDPRSAFMFGSLTVYNSMTQIVDRIFRVPVNDKPITILELTGLPTEIINVVVSVLCRLSFDFALWSEGQVPVTLVCEEAHRYVPSNTSLSFEPYKRHRQDRQGGPQVWCLAVHCHPATGRDRPTILSQCNTVFALRMSNDRDQQIVNSAISDTGAGLLEFCDRPWPARGHCLWRQRHAAGVHQVRRIAQALPTAQLDRLLLGEVAEVGGRCGFPGKHRRSLAQCIVGFGPQNRPPGGAVCGSRKPAGGPDIVGRRPGRCRGAQPAAARAHHDARRTAPARPPPRCPAAVLRRRCSGGSAQAGSALRALRDRLQQR